MVSEPWSVGVRWFSDGLVKVSDGHMTSGRCQMVLKRCQMVSEKCQIFFFCVRRYQKISDGPEKMPDSHRMVKGRYHIFLEEGLGNVSDGWGKISDGHKGVRCSG